MALGIPIAIWRMWQRRGYLREARIRVGGLIGRPWFATSPPRLRAKTHEVDGRDRLLARPVLRRPRALRGGARIWREIGDEREIANATYNLSFCYTMGIAQELPPDARARADALLSESLAIYRKLGDEQGEANVFWGIGIQHYFARDNAAAAPAFEAALALYRRLGDRTQEAWSLHQIGLSRLKLGETRRRARPLLADGLRLFMAAGDVAGVTLGLDDLSAVAIADGDLVRAARGCRAWPAGSRRARAPASPASWRRRSRWPTGPTRGPPWRPRTSPATRPRARR